MRSEEAVENPFLNRNKVTNPSEFFGREETIERVLAKLRYSEPQSVAIIGERRIGKSSLLTYTHHLITSQQHNNSIDGKLVAILLDPEELVIDSPDSLTWVIIDELISTNATLGKYICEHPAPQVITTMPNRRPEIILKNLLRSASADGYRFLFFIDEFGLIARNQALQEVHYLHYLRGISDNYTLGFVTSSRQPLAEVCSEISQAASPFDNNFSQPIRLGLLTEEDCRRLIRGRLREVDGNELEFRDSDIEEVITLAGKHPYYLKIACAHLFDWIVEGRSNQDAWQDRFQCEANEEFARMWRACNDEERDWILRAQQRDNVSKKESIAHETVRSLSDRGLLQEESDGTFFELFSEGLSNYITEYVNALQDDYNATEARIAAGYVDWNAKELESVLNRLERLTMEGKKRDDIASSFEATYGKCEKLIGIITAIEKLVLAMATYEVNAEARPDESEVYKRAVQKKLDSLVELFSKEGWFDNDKDDSLSIHTGSSLLNQLTEYLKLKKRDRVFGNGYDLVLTTHVRFMKAHTYTNFKSFDKRIHEALNRLVEVYDFQRAQEVLEPKLSRVLSFLSKNFLRRPVLTMLTIVLVPYLAAGGIQSLIQQPGIITTSTGHESDLFVSIGILLFHGFLFSTMLLFSVHNKQPWLHDAHKFYKQLLFPKGIHGEVIAPIGILVVLWMLFLEIDENHLLLIMTIAALSSLLTVFGFAWSRISKLTSLSVAIKRSLYISSTEFFKALCLCTIASVLYVRFFTRNLSEPLSPEHIFFPQTIIISNNFVIHVPLLFTWTVIMFSANMLCLICKPEKN